MLSYAEKLNYDEVGDSNIVARKPTRSIRRSLIPNQVLNEEDYYLKRRASCISSLGE